MPEIRAEIITAPFCGAPDYHLITAVFPAPGIASFLFIAQSDTPGLTIDLIRVDLLPRSWPRLADMYQLLLSNLRDRTYPEIIATSREDLVFQFHTAGDPLKGDSYTVGRLIDMGGSVCAIQVIRKLYALSPGELKERIQFVRDVHVDTTALHARSTCRSEFASGCLRGATRLDEAFERMTRTRKEPDDLAELEQIVGQASPLHEPIIKWVALAKIVAIDILEGGRVESFAAARRMLDLIALNLDDRRSADGYQSFSQQIRNVLAPLAELLLYEKEGDHSPRAHRAAALWRLRAGLEDSPTRAAPFAVTAAFAEAYAQMAIEAPVDVALAHATTDALRGAEPIRETVEMLDAVASRMAHVARRRHKTLLQGSCLAADLAQLVVERATLSGSLDFLTYTGESVKISQWQLNAQMALFNLSQASLDRASRSTHRHDAPSLVYLRPLGTARRELVPNGFSKRLYATDQRLRLLPDRISIEAALQVALTPDFTTQALGGPVDIFGMGRGTILASGADSWQDYAGLMIKHADLISVLPADSEGLGWELGEVLRQGVARKTMFVLPPRDGNEMPAPPAVRQRLSAIGYRLPEDLLPGFILLDANGACEQHLSFEHLWDGKLSGELRERLRTA